MQRLGLTASAPEAGAERADLAANYHVLLALKALIAACMAVWISSL